MPPMLAFSFGRALHRITVDARLPVPNGIISHHAGGAHTLPRGPLNVAALRRPWGRGGAHTSGPAEPVAASKQRLVINALPPVAIRTTVVAMRWMTPHVLAVLSFREELVLLEAATGQPIDAVPLRDADLVYQAHFAGLAAAARAAAAAAPPSPTTPQSAASVASSSVGDRAVNVFAQSLRVQRQAVLLLVCIPDDFSTLERRGPRSVLLPTAFDPFAACAVAVRPASAGLARSAGLPFDVVDRQN